MSRSFSILASMLLLLAGCGGTTSSHKAGAGDVKNLSGAGATFPAPLYAAWAESYRKETGIAVNFQPIGSGGGIQQIEAKTVDFGATDMPLNPEELDKAKLYQFPAVVGGVVPIVNIPGIGAGQLKLTGALLGDIFLGKLKKWNAPQIAAINPGVKLPATPITVVHRSDGSGTTYLFTTYLAMKGRPWMTAVGPGESVHWPTGTGGKGNDGVAAFVKQTVGAIGYVEYAYARQVGSTTVLLQNVDGQFAAPSAEAFGAAATGADWQNAKGNYLLLLDQPGANTWPITGATFILVDRQPANAAHVRGVLAFFDWAFTSGAATATTLDYVPLSPRVQEMIRSQWTTAIIANGKPI